MDTINNIDRARLHSFIVGNGKVNYILLETFPIMFSGWECDEIGYLVEIEGKKKVILTTHGQFYIAKVSELRAKLDEYATATNALKNALNQLK